MSHQALREYLLAIVDRYLKASKLEKSKILHEAELVCKISRKQMPVPREIYAVKDECVHAS